MKEKQSLDFLKISKYRNKFTDEQNETFLTDLIGSYIYESHPKLLQFLLNDDMEGFEEHVKYMNSTGKKLHELLK